MKRPLLFGRKGAGKDPAVVLRLHCLRFRRMLEEYRALHGLLADGREKLRGEYILDRHYVEALVEEALERGARVVKDACLLVHEGGEQLFEGFDNLAAEARRRLAVPPGTAPPGAGRAAEEEAMEPEYRLLAAVLDWMEGAAVEPSLRSLVLECFHHAVAGTAAMPPPRACDRIRCGPVAAPAEILVKDTGVEERFKPGGGSSTEAGRRLLRLLLEGAEGAGGTAAGPPDGTPGRAARTWIAAVRERRLSLWRAPAPPLLRLEVHLGEVPGEDLLVLYAGEGITLEDGAFVSFQVESGARGRLAWFSCDTAEGIENRLAALGAWLFAGRVGMEP